MTDQKTPDKDELISLEDAAKICGLSRASLRRYAWQGKLKARKIANVWVTTLADVEDYLENRQRKRKLRGRSGFD
jgi:predicted site-specific integrase-resolvase